MRVLITPNIRLKSFVFMNRTTELIDSYEEKVVVVNNDKEVSSDDNPHGIKDLCE